MNIFRFEHPSNKLGPYHQQLPRLQLPFICTHGDVRHPNPPEEGLDDETFRRCGFKSVEQMNEWFTEGEQKIMFQNGFVLQRLSCDPEARLYYALDIGHWQVVFDKDQFEVDMICKE